MIISLIVKIARAIVLFIKMRLGKDDGGSGGGSAKNGKLEIIGDFLPEGIPCDSGEWFKDGLPDSVTIHWVGPYPQQTPKVVRDWWATGGLEASAHFVIKDGECMQCWPTGKVCWHCGNLEGNRSSAGIEVIPLDTEGQFSVASIATLKALLDEVYPGLPLMRHCDWSGKDCPKYYVDGEKWEELKALLGRA